MAVFKGDPDEHEPDSAVINRSATGPDTGAPDGMATEAGSVGVVEPGGEWAESGTTLPEPVKTRTTGIAPRPEADSD